MSSIAFWIQVLADNGVAIRRISQQEMWSGEGVGIPTARGAPAAGAVPCSARAGRPQSDGGGKIADRVGAPPTVIAISRCAQSSLPLLSCTMADSGPEV